MNLAFLTFNVTFLAGLLCYQHYLGKRAQELEECRQSLVEQGAYLETRAALLDATRVYLRGERDKIDADYVRLIRAATVVPKRGPEDVPDPGDVDPSQRRWMEN
jgi:hypothetical protein